MALAPKHRVQEHPPLSLYIHIPWCIRKCPYCDFNSHTTGGKELPETLYVQKLLEDFQSEAQWFQNRSIQSIFIGGGTPSLFSPAALQTLLEGLNKHQAFRKDIEITLEANPGTFEQQKFHDFYAIGINRLSVGIQSFNEQHLKQLGRIHDPKQAIQAVSMANQAGFENINIDIMHGLPQQSIEQMQEDLRQGIRLDTPHLSWYQLTIEPNTEFYSRPPALPEDEVLWEMTHLGQSILKTAGFTHYEVSAYAKPDHASQHNLNYWTFGDYIGIGAGAHGKLTDISKGIITRRWKKRQPTAYLNVIMAKDFSAGESIIDTSQLPFEFLMNAFRLNEGFSIELFEKRTYRSFQDIHPHFQIAKDKNLLTITDSWIKPTELGQRYLNNLLEIFLDLDLAT